MVAEDILENCRWWFGCSEPSGIARLAKCKPPSVDHLKDMQMDFVIHSQFRHRGSIGFMLRLIQMYSGNQA